MPFPQNSFAHVRGAGTVGLQYFHRNACFCLPASPFIWSSCTMLLEILSLIAFISTSSTSPMPASNATSPYSTSNLTLGASKFRCDGATFGRNLVPRSCLQAWSFIPVRITRQLSFGDRSDVGKTYDVGLPKRYLSCE